MSTFRQPQRSMSGNHLLPASRPDSATFEPVPRVPTYTLITWTFGRGSVIWRIWPAVLLHTLFAAGISYLSIEGIVHLEIPNIMLTVLGVVIGFVISYRAMSGYERYWLGRGCWSDIVRNTRTLSRLIWFHVPPHLSPKTPEEIQAGQSLRSVQELNKVMAEKSMALDLIHGFAVALKHHLRGEVGIYYEDLYHLIRPLHDHEHTADDELARASTSTLPSPHRGHQITTHVSAAQSGIPASGVSPLPNPVIPPINAYGTFRAETIRPSLSARSRESHFSSISSVSRPLLPSVRPPSETVMNKASGDFVPFARPWNSLKRALGFRRQESVNGLSSAVTENDPYVVKRRWKGPVQEALHMKHHPRVVGEGENLPAEIVRCLSEWLSVLEDRGSASGPTVAMMIGTLAAFEDSLTSLERILTTPLPFVYSVHISTVWVYLFFLPFQLVSQFGYYTVPGVALAAFIYLGFIAAGEEIEQPFGYDDNDLDLDLFCNEIIGVDIKHLKTSPALNAYLGPLQEDPQIVHRRSMTLNGISSSTMLSPAVAP